MRLIFLLMKFFGQEKIRLAKKLLTGNKHYDCVIGFRPGICTQIAAFAVNADKRITWWHHGEVNVEHDSYLEAANACTQIAVVSKACHQMLVAAFPSLKDKLIVVPNMLDSDAVRKKADAFQPYDKGGEFHIVTLCRLSPEKHIENAIFTAWKLKEVGIAFQWHIVGGGCDYDKIFNLVKEHHLEKYVIMEGNQVNPYPYIKNADLFVHPSYVESQGIVVLEAMSLGIPSVVTKSLGPCEFIDNGVNGILTEQSPESLAEKVLEILTDRELYNRIKANTHCPEQFAPANVIRIIEMLLGR